MSRAWSPERVDALRQMVEVEGLTSSQAADRLGITRHAVMGAAHRAGLRWARAVGSNQQQAVIREDAPTLVVPRIGPPSAAAVRLAQFDPIVRRALSGVAPDRRGWD